MCEGESDNVPVVVGVAGVAVLSGGDHGVRAEGDGRLEGGSGQYWPPDGAHNPGHDDDSRCSVLLCFGDGQIKEGDGRKVVAVDVEGCRTLGAGVACPRGGGEGVGSGGLWGGVAAPVDVKAVIRVVGEPVVCQRQVMLVGECDDPFPCDGADASGVCVV